MTASFASVFQSAARISRETLYATELDPQLPLHLVADARVPFLGYCGPQYVAGNPVLLAINPGGGRDSYAERHGPDEELIPLIEDFLQAHADEPPTAFASMSRVYMQHVQTWSIRSVLTPTLSACGKGIDEICFLNLFPYRTRNDRMPRARAVAAAWTMIVAPLLSALRPRMLIALGKKAGGVAEKFRHEAGLFVVERTNGDKYVCEGAKKVFEEIRAAVE